MTKSQPFRAWVVDKQQRYSYIIGALENFIDYAEQNFLDEIACDTPEELRVRLRQLEPNGFWDTIDYFFDFFRRCKYDTVKAKVDALER